MTNNKKDFLFAIALSDDEIDKGYTETIQKDYGLTDEDIKELKMAHLFRFSDNARFSQFDADIVLISYFKETYYSTGDSEPIERVKNEDIVALVDKNCECEIIR